MKRLLALLLAATVASCGGGEEDENGNEVVLSDLKSIDEGIQRSLALPPANYRVEITSSNNGVVVSWLGAETGNAGCATSKEVKVYTATCRLVIQGQLLILNPTTFGLGGSEVVSTRISKL